MENMIYYFQENVAEIAKLYTVDANCYIFIFEPGESDSVVIFF